MASNKYKYGALMLPDNIFNNWILTMVMEKPIQLTIVSEVPLASSATFCATRVENNGESAITTNPQKNKNAMSSGVALLSKKNGDSKQQQQDKHKAMVAILFAPKRCDNKPPATQASAPQAMIKNENKGTLILLL